MSGPKRNEDSLNTIGVVVVGICGAVMVYVSITALQAFYMNDTSELQTMQDYGGQDTTAKSHKAEEMRNITEPQMGAQPSISIDRAMDLVVSDTKAGKPVVPAVQIGADGQAWKPKATEAPHSGIPELLTTPAAPAPAAAPAGAGAGSGSGAGSAAPAAVPAATGSPADNKKVPGGGGAPTGAGAGSAHLVPPGTGGHAR